MDRKQSPGAKPAASKRPGRPKGTKLDFSGVPGEVVSLDSLPRLDFSRHQRQSPYDALLERLLDAPKNSALKFGDPRARATIGVRARKKGLKVEFAECDGTLYVRIVGFLNEDEPDAKDAMQVLRAMAAGFAAPVTISDHIVRSGGEMTPGRVLATLKQMESAGTVRKAGDGTWKMTAKAA